MEKINIKRTYNTSPPKEISWWDPCFAVSKMSQQMIAIIRAAHKTLGKRRRVRHGILK